MLTHLVICCRAIFWPSLKLWFTMAPILLQSDPSLFIIEVDTSEVSMRAMLSHHQGAPPKLSPVAFYAKKLSPVEKNCGELQTPCFWLLRNGDGIQTKTTSSTSGGPNNCLLAKPYGVSLHSISVHNFLQTQIQEWESRCSVQNLWSRIFYNQRTTHHWAPLLSHSSTLVE